MSTQQLIPSLRGLPLSILKKKYDDMTPEERKLAGFVRHATQQEFEDSQQGQNGGAPPDFGGRVLANPDNIQVSDDTDSGIPALRLPNGVSAETQNFSGQPQMDTSNPDPAQVIPPQMQTIGANFSQQAAPDTLPADFQKWDAAPDTLPADFEHFDTPKTENTTEEEPGILDREIPLTSHWNATLQGLQNIARGGKQAIEGAYEMGKLPSTKEEWAAFAAGGPTGLLMYRTNKGAVSTGKQAVQVPAAIKDINESPDPTGTYMKVAGRTAGEAGGQALVALGAEGAGKIAPKVAEAATSAKASVKPTLRVTGETLKTVGKSLDPDVVGLVSPRTAHALRLANKVGKVASKLGKETPVVEAPANALAERVLPPELTTKTRSLPGQISAERIYGPKPKPAQPIPSRPGLQLKGEIAEEVKPANALAERVKPEPAKSPYSDDAPDMQRKAEPPTKEDIQETRDIQESVRNAASMEQLQRLRAGRREYQAPTKGELTEAADKYLGKTRAEAPVKLTKTPGVNYSEPAGYKVTPENAQADLTPALKASLENLQVKRGGVMASADPKVLTERWGVTEQSLKAGREQTRSMKPQETEAEIQRLTEAYKKGKPVEPVMETRDANNNIIDVDGRGRAIAAQRAGITRIPVIVRRLGVSAPK